MVFRTTPLGRAALRGKARAAVLVVLLLPFAAACSDASGGNGAAPSLSRPPSSSAPAVSTPADSPPATAPADPAAAEQEIGRNWAKFFDPAVDMAGKAAILENGDAMTAVLKGFGGDQRGQDVKATVSKVDFTSPTEAAVTYDLTLKGATALPGAQGTAVLQDQVWKVSVKTLCALVQLSGNESVPPTGC
jgi:hypothetical protein